MNPHSSLIKTHIRPGVNTSATAGIQSIYGGTLDTYIQACNLFQLLVFLVLTDNVLHDLISDYSKSYRTERQRGTIMLLPGILHFNYSKGCVPQIIFVIKSDWSSYVLPHAQYFRQLVYLITSSKRARLRLGRPSSPCALGPASKELEIRDKP